MFEFLKENDFIDIDVGDNQSILENYLISKMRQDISKCHYDFMHGALGIGLYFLKKETHNDVIIELIDYLYSTAEKGLVNKTFKWKSLINSENREYGYNIALSHGISSIIIFLCRTLKRNIKDGRVYELLNGSVNYILSQFRDPLLFGSCFPSQSSENSSSMSNRPSRLAWCYGDLGVAMALWQAGKTVGNKEWENVGKEALLHSMKRLSPPATNVLDAGICHGSAGIAMIYKRMYLDTKDSIFLQSSDYWINQTLKQAHFDEGLAGYKTYEHPDWKCDYTLLTGISGIGLTFLSFAMQDQIWDEMFLIS